MVAEAQAWTAGHEAGARPVYLTSASASTCPTSNCLSRKTRSWLGRRWAETEGTGQDTTWCEAGNMGLSVSGQLWERADATGVAEELSEKEVREGAARAAPKGQQEERRVFRGRAGASPEKQEQNGVPHETPPRESFKNKVVARLSAVRCWNPHAPWSLLHLAIQIFN